MEKLDRSTRAVLEAVQALPGGGAPGFTPAAVLAALREANAPQGAWEVRGALSALERAGQVRWDEASGRWHPHDAHAARS